MKRQYSLAWFLLCAAGVANAHPGHRLAGLGLAGHGLENFYAGFSHPFTGWDHLLVMLGIGMWAIKLRGKAIWQLPLTFVSMMLLGAVFTGAEFGGLGISVAGLETGIAASVMAMGMLLLISLPLPRALQLALVAVFAVLHGAAHGVELNIQHAVNPLFGMLLATGLLHGLGLCVGMRHAIVSVWLQRGLACLMVLLGGYLLIA